MGNDKLEPCPFCGSDVKKVKHFPQYVTCPNIKCALSGRCFTPEEWNRRASVTKKKVKRAIEKGLKEWTNTFNCMIPVNVSEVKRTIFTKLE